MNTIVVALLLLLLAGCRAEHEMNAGTGVVGDDAPAAVGTDGRARVANHVWVRSDEGSPLGSIRVFLDDGTLLLDSCWEVYRLTRWELLSDSTLRWEEESAQIRADVLALDDHEMTLRLHLTSGAEEQRFRRAGVPFVCPELPR